MIDKQIIIDGCDVSGCEWIREIELDSEYICTCNSLNKTSGYCKYNPNCHYKLYKRKKQELTHFKKENEKLLQTIIKDQAEIIQKNIDETNILLMKENMDLQQQLKAKEQECEELKYHVDFVNNMNDTYCKQSNNYRQALTEIKEIAKPYQKDIDKICGNCRRYDGCHACCMDTLNNYEYRTGTTKACDKFIELKDFDINKLANQILQEISEVEK